jgi:hypothetical protein
MLPLNKATQCSASIDRSSGLCRKKNIFFELVSSVPPSDLNKDDKQPL